MKKINNFLENIPIGFKFKTQVLSNSMFPTFQKGDFLTIKKTPFQKLKIGDIILFKLKNLKNPATHRIIKISYKTKQITTKGDANPIEDSEKITPEKYIGKVIRTNKSS